MKFQILRQLFQFLTIPILIYSVQRKMTEKGFKYLPFIPLNLKER